jgi:hypothetical protein
MKDKKIKKATNDRRDQVEQQKSHLHASILTMTEKSYLVEQECQARSGPYLFVTRSYTILLHVTRSKRILLHYEIKSCPSTLNAGYMKSMNCNDSSIYSHPPNLLVLPILKEKEKISNIPATRNFRLTLRFGKECLIDSVTSSCSYSQDNFVDF